MSGSRMNLATDNHRPDGEGLPVVTPKAMPLGVRGAVAGGFLALTTFLGAFLLFFLEPLIARFVLPWFGGTAGVWTTCLLFFQVCLLAGYAYAHGLVRWGSPRMQALFHVCLLGIAFVALPIVPGVDWRPAPESAPVTHLLVLLAACIGLPFLALSATGPLMQAWFCRLYPGRSPYRLYALSNVGSLLALVSYPFVFEPRLSRLSQAGLWSGLFAVFALSGGLSAWALWRAGREPPTPSGTGNPLTAVPPAVGFRHRLLWLAWPACASLLLMAVTNKLCQDVAVIPFLWVLPLGLYLLSFVLCFERASWYSRRFFHPALAVAVLAIGYAMTEFDHPPWAMQIGLYGVGLFVMCMVCHGEVYRLRPPPEELTHFYLMIAAGGALGGGFVVVAAPALFRSYAELGVGLGLLAFLMVITHALERIRLTVGSRPVPVWLFSLGGSILLLVFLSGLAWRESYQSLESRRSFYGVFHVRDHGADKPFYHYRTLVSGSITHGCQYQHPVKARWPTSYYHRESGVGLVFTHLPEAGARRIGLVGLGVGTLAVYGRPADVMRFYEINPDVVELARKHFTYLAQAEAGVEIVLGDARLSLEHEPDQRFDVLVLDAFSGDAIPVHLLTREAFDTYWRHLQPEGVLAINISNRHVDLVPVLRGEALHRHATMASINHRVPRDVPEAAASHWVLLTRGETARQIRELRFEGPVSNQPPARLAEWTDDFVSLFSVLKSRAR